jgi:hypothetical protein
MRTGQPIIGRPAWYDRNPSSKAQYFETGGISPHALTERWSYTVPAGKKAMVELLQVKVERRTAATTPGQAQAYVFITPYGGSTRYMLNAVIWTNGAGDKDVQTITGTLALYQGDVISGQTQDTSNGGTCYYFLSYKISEFDA